MVTTFFHVTVLYCFSNRVLRIPESGSPSAPSKKSVQNIGDKNGWVTQRTIQEKCRQTKMAGGPTDEARQLCNKQSTQNRKVHAYPALKQEYFKTRDKNGRDQSAK